MGVLRRHPAFRALFVARCVSFAGDAVSMVALMLHVATSTGQALMVAALLLAGDFVPSLVAPFAGVLADRLDRRRLMIACELAQALLVGLIALRLPPLVPLLALVAVRAIAGQIFAPASRAAVPALVPDEDLGPANATLGFGTNAAELAGPLIAAAVLPFGGVRGVLWLDAASFALSALLLTRLPALPRERRERTRGEIWEGIRYIRSHRTLRIVAIGFVAIVLCTGVDDVALVVLAKENLRLSDSAAAVVLGAIGFGLAAGFAVLTRVRTDSQRLLVIGFAVSSAGNLLTGLVPYAVPVFAMQAARGVGIAAIDVASNTLLQRLVPDALLGRVFAGLYGAIGVAAALSYVGGGLLLDATSAPVTLVVAGAGGVVAAGVTAACLFGHRRRLC